MGYCLVDRFQHRRNEFLFTGGFPCRPPASNTISDLTLGSDWDIWRCLKCQGALQYDPSTLRPGLLAVRSPAADRERHLDRQGPETATTTRSPSSSTIARSGPSFVSGSGLPGFATAASAVPATRCSGTCPTTPGPRSARRGRRRRRLSRLAAGRLANRRRGHLALPARGLPPPRGRPIGLAGSGRSGRAAARESPFRRRSLDRCLQLLQ